MEQKLPIIAKKFWNIVRVAYYMVRKNISKPKLLSDLDMLMKRGKLAGKAAIHNLMFHHHHHHNNNSDGGSSSDGDRQIPPGEHEFSCSSTPVQQTFQLPLHLNKRTRSRSPPPPPEPSEADLFAAAMEELAASPDLRGVGPSPLVRVVDSPLPLLLSGVEEDEHVDEAAEEFIMKFYRDLERQRTMAS